MAVKAVRVVVVVVTNVIRLFTGIILFAAFSEVFAAVLAEDRADILTHSYQGGGMDITGPSILVRKGDDKTFSAYANYYVDTISSASIDVEALGASPYTEERTENSVGVDILHGKSIMSLGYTNSEENDYVSDSFSFGLSMDMFGDLTTISMGFMKGHDEVFRMTRDLDQNKIRDTAFAEQVDRRRYSVGLTQILTKNLIIGLNFETITDQGYLNNPYRQYRYLENNILKNAFEVYPNTRTSRAGSIKLRYYLPYRAAIFYKSRMFVDDWGIEASDAEIGYTHPIGDDLIIELKYRNYVQTSADFYSDIFSEASTQASDFRARDKEMSSFTNITFGVGISYEFAKNGWWEFDKASANLVYDYMKFEYDDFRDARVEDVNAGEEPLYSFTANVLQLFISVWY